MFEIVEEEYKLFLNDMKNGETFCQYIDESFYEDEYSHNDIDEMQEEFTEKVKQWLHDNKPGEYVVSGGWCVFVMTIDEAMKRNIYRMEQFIVK